ncbi:MAG: dephospho-CoA kinase [Candidatus Solibacter usitatus]|nr:dephospho-CoA kinase [Candidatus Solibacter usitatus]
MLRAGLTGGLATGKSFVGKCLADLGCRLLKADEIGHDLLQPGGAAYPAVVGAFGQQILDPEGCIDRRVLGGIVFQDPTKLGLLNSLVHPAVVAREEQWIDETRRADPHAIAVVEAAILIETGSYKRFDTIILTVCSREQQIERAMKRDGLSRDEVLDRLDRQMSLDEKRKFAQYVIDTSGDKEMTVRQVRDLYGALRMRKP